MPVRVFDLVFGLMILGMVGLLGSSVGQMLALMLLAQWITGGGRRRRRRW
jgi:hypothetical protein